MQRCFQPSKNEEITLRREFIFVVIVKEVQSKVGGWEKILNGGGWPYNWGVYNRGIV